MKAILDENAMIVASAAADKDHYSRALQCVKIGDSTIVACDGFMLAICKITTEPEHGESILVSADEILNALEVFDGETVQLECKDSIVKITSKTKESTVLTTEVVDHAKYPDYSYILRAMEAKAITRLSPTRLLKVFDVLPDTDIPFVRIEVTGEQNPVKIMQGDTIVYLMPVAP